MVQFSSVIEQGREAPPNTARSGLGRWALLFGLDSSERYFPFRELALPPNRLHKPFGNLSRKEFELESQSQVTSSGVFFGMVFLKQIKRSAL